MTYDKLLNVRDFSWFVIQANNYCNLNCTHCSSLCNIPFDPKSPNPFKRSKQHISLESVELLCQRFKGIGEEQSHVLTGGEITALPLTHLKGIINILKSYKRRVLIFTNGYGLMDIPKENLFQIDSIILSDHGVNTQHFKDCGEYLAKIGYTGTVKESVTLKHLNPHKAMKAPINEASTCKNWLHNLALWDNVIYPCCILYSVMLIRNNERIQNDLIDAGWNLGNPNLIDTLQNHKETLPQSSRYECLNHCWSPRYGYVGKIKIKPHPNNQIKRTTN